MCKKRLRKAPRNSLNESPSEKEGKLDDEPQNQGLSGGLNESPSEKEGKWAVIGITSSSSKPPQ